MYSQRVRQIPKPKMLFKELAPHNGRVTRRKPIDLNGPKLGTIGNGAGLVKGALIPLFAPKADRLARGKGVKRVIRVIGLQIIGVDVKLAVGHDGCGNVANEVRSGQNWTVL